MAARHKLYHQADIEGATTEWENLDANELAENPEHQADSSFGTAAVTAVAAESKEDIILDDNEENGIPLAQSIFASLRKNGYDVGWFGKNHGTGKAHKDNFEAYVVPDPGNGTVFTEEIFNKLDYLAEDGEFKGNTSECFNVCYGENYGSCSDSESRTNCGCECGSGSSYIENAILSHIESPNILSAGEITTVLTGQNKHVTDALTDRVVDYIASQSGGIRPFFAWVAFHAPHDTKFGDRQNGSLYLSVEAYFQAAEDQLMAIGKARTYDADFTGYDMSVFGKFGVIPRLDLFLKFYLKKRSYYEDELNLTGGDIKEKLENEGLKEALYAGMIETLDHSVGRIVEAIENAGIAQDTLIVLISDNGGADRHTSNAPLAGNKGFLREGGVRVPMIATWADHIDAREFNQPVHVVDMFPTFLDLAGDTDGELTSPDVTLDGISIKAVLDKDSGAAEVDIERTSPLFWHLPGYIKEKVRPMTVFQSAVGTQQAHKLYYYYEWGSYQFYNTTSDYEESQNLLSPDHSAGQPESFEWLDLSWSMIRALVDFGAEYPTQDGVNLRPSPMAFTVSSPTGYFLSDALGNLPTVDGDPWLVVPANKSGDYYLQHASSLQRLRVKTANNTLELIGGDGEKYTNFSARWIFTEDASGGFHLKNKATEEYLRLDGSSGVLSLGASNPTAWQFRGVGEYPTQDSPVTIQAVGSQVYLVDSLGQISTHSYVGDAWVKELRAGTSDVYYLRHASTHQRLRVNDSDSMLELVDGKSFLYSDSGAQWMFNGVSGGYRLENAQQKPDGTWVYRYLKESAGVLSLTEDAQEATTWKYTDTSP